MTELSHSWDLYSDLKGRRVLITGAASGIGKATARLFAQCGAIVAVNHLPDDERGPNTVKEINDLDQHCLSAPGDVADAASCDAMVEKVIDRLGGLDILINNAGTSATVQPIAFDDLDALDEAFWQRVFSTNLFGPFRCTKLAVPALRIGGGVIVNTASISAFGRSGSSIAYAASKAGLVNMTTNLAKALAPDIRVNAVAPGLVNSPWTKPWPKEQKQRSIDSSLLPRMVEPEDIARTMLFLCVNTAMTGQTITVDCGRHS
ncbi:MAG: SDR family oxidoreductase [Pseudomonadota bacterium]